MNDENEKRMSQLVKLLISKDRILNSNYICSKLGVSNRTLRDDIRKFRPILQENGVELISKFGVGYTYEIKDNQRYYEFIHHLMKQEANSQYLVPVLPEERIHYIIRLFLSVDDYIKIDDIADRLFVSRATLNNDLKEVRRSLNHFHLSLKSRPRYGLIISGDEFHKRLCIAQYFFYIENTDETSMKKGAFGEQQTKIRSILYETICEEKFKLTDIGFQNLIIHLSITLKRMSASAFLEADEQYAELESHREYQIAQKICQKLTEEFQVEFPKQEVYFVTIHLLGKKVMAKNSQFVITEELNSVLQEIFREIKQSYSVDFSGDFDLYTQLALHFQPMIDRLTYGLLIPNPLLDQIKEQNFQAFEMAVLAAQVIQKQLSLIPEESEIGYLALHFALGIERSTKPISKKNIIIVCASGAGSSQILQYKIKQTFQKYIGEICVTELYELSQLDQEQFDLILTTVPLNTKMKLPVIQVNYFLDDTDIIQVSQKLSLVENFSEIIDRYFKEDFFFTDITGTTSEEIIREICHRVEEKLALPDRFVDSVLQREQFARTSFGNQTALPHPMKPMNEVGFCGIAILSRAVKWGNQMVKYVFLLGPEVEKGSHEIFLNELLSSFILNASLIHELEQEPTYMNFIKLMKENIDKSSSTDASELFV